MSPLKLLLVDEDDSFKPVITLKMKEAGYLIDVCGSKKSAVGMLLESKYDVVLLDYRSKKYCGLKVLEWMSEQKIDTPSILFISAETQIEEVETAKLGAYNYFIKDVEDVIHLSMTINNVYERQMIKKRSFYEISTQSQLKSIKVAEIFHSTLSSVSDVVNNRLSVLTLNLQEDMQSLLPVVKEGAHTQFIQVFNDIARDLNVVTMSVRAMLNLSSAMCKHIGTNGEMHNLENLMRKQMDMLESISKESIERAGINSVVDD